MYKCEKKHDDMANTPEKGKTGIPAGMKRSFEQSSGFSFDDVRVHYSSEKPAQLHAHAYTQGNDVFVAPGQEKHLPHELGHVVQQKSNMVKPTENLGGLPLNTDPAMERNADNIAQNAEKSAPFSENTGDAPLQAKAIDGVVQMASEDVYNWTAGLASTLLTGLGMVGGIGSFLYSKNKDRKHKYIDDMEKDADSAEEARDEAETAYYETVNENDGDKKKSKAIETRKAALKAMRFARQVRFKYRASKPEGLWNKIPIIKDDPQKNKNAIYAVKRASKAENEAKKFANDANHLENASIGARGENLDLNIPNANSVAEAYGNMNGYDESATNSFEDDYQNNENAGVENVGE